MWRWHLLGGALCYLASDTQSALTFICLATDAWYTFLQPSALSLHQGVHGTLKRLVFSIYPLILSPPVRLAWFSTCCFWCSLKVIVLGNKTLLLMPRLGQRAENMPQNSGSYQKCPSEDSSLMITIGSRKLTDIFSKVKWITKYALINFLSFLLYVVYVCFS